MLTYFSAVIGLHCYGVVLSNGFVEIVLCLPCLVRFEVSLEEVRVAPKNETSCSPSPCT